MHVMKKLTTMFALLAVIQYPAQARADVPVHAQLAGSSAELDSIIGQQMREVGIVGIGAAIIVDRKVVWTKGYGMADKTRALPFTPDTIMSVGSIAKPFVGVAMMRAVHEDRLSLDADVNTYLPFKVVNPHFPEEKITLRQLATHSSGITDRWEVYSETYRYGEDSPVPLGVFLEQYFSPEGSDYSRENFLDAKPGTLREYSNIGAALAGYIVERAVGKPLNEYTREHIFVPLHMTSTGWFMSEVDLSKHSRLYVSHNGHIVPIPLYGITTYPDGGVRTSVADLSKFFIALLNDGSYGGTRILDPESTREMIRFQFNDANRPENFPADEGNSGLFWRTKFNGKRVGHGGNDPGIQTEMLADISRETGVILFMNTSLSGPEQRASAVIFNALWNRAEALKVELRRTAGS